MKIALEKCERSTENLNKHKVCQFLSTLLGQTLFTRNIFLLAIVPLFLALFGPTFVSFAAVVVDIVVVAAATAAAAIIVVNFMH